MYENAFGTVAIRRDGDVLEVTTFRIEHEYADFRRPHRLEFGDDITADLARRDFTVNAIAWGRRAATTRRRPSLDPFGGLDDLDARVLRAVGEPATRFREDALRMVRAVRLAPTLELHVEPGDAAAIARERAARRAPLRGAVGAELAEAARGAPAVGRAPARGGDWARRRPVARARGPARDPPEQDRRRGPLGPHAADRGRRAGGPPGRPARRALHDIGKPATLADGHFHHHDAAGADLARELLRRLRYPRAAAEVVEHLIRNHMFTVDPDASDAAIRRFILRIGLDRIDALFALRRADDIGSGLPPDDPALLAFRARIDAEIAAEAALDRSALRIDGNDLMRELGLEPGPRLGRMIDELVELVIADPALNEPPTLLLLAQGMLADMQDEGSK